MIEPHTRQHFVPKTYLARFSENKNGVWVYDKHISKSYMVSIKKICYEENFYTIEQKYIPEEAKDMMNPLSIEDDFFAEHIESQLSDFLDVLEDIYNKYNVSEDLDLNEIMDLPEECVDQILFFLVIQQFRSPFARETVIESLNDLRTQINDFLKDEKKNEIVKSFLYETNKNNGSVLDHFMVLFGDGSAIQSTIEKLKTYTVYLAISMDKEFYTSDSPIIVDNDCFGRYENLTLNKVGTTAFFPLTKHMLAVVEDTSLIDINSDLNRKVIFCKPDFVDLINMGEYITSNRYVVSSKDQFDKIKAVKNKCGVELNLKNVKEVFEKL